MKQTAEELLSNLHASINEVFEKIDNKYDELKKNKDTDDVTVAHYTDKIIRAWHTKYGRL